VPQRPPAHPPNQQEHVLTGGSDRTGAGQPLNGFAWHPSPEITSATQRQRVDGRGRGGPGSKRALKVIAEQRAAHAFLKDEPAPLVTEGNGRMRWWTYAGGAGNRVLANLLESALGERVSASNAHVTFSGDAAKSETAIRQAIDELAARALLRWEDVVPYADAGGRARVSKFQPCLPPALELKLIARETLGLDDANGALTEWHHGS
jgi:ATP-dependent helicase Lhr and Lhr-like helicase